MLDKPSEEIKQRLNIVDIVQEYVQLKKAGQNYRACCPFHNEKTPSFMVSEDKQIFKCFGCGLGGDVFSFVMKIEGIEFIDALKLLAQKAGIELKKQDPKTQTKRNRLLEILDLAAKFYHQALLSSKSGEIARDYLKKRKVEEITQDEFKLGFSPDSWDALSNFLKKRGFTSDEILESGLVVRKENGLGYYDRFRNRLIFPVWDVHGNVVGFGGRILQGDDKQAKYINTPQTFIYDKSRILYAIDKARQDIRKKDQAIIVEGYMDAIASFEAGIKNVVASSGTALTSEQVELLKRFTNNVILSFDMDLAGNMATKRGIDLALRAGFNIKILEVPEGKDPDECIKKDVKIWQKAIESSKSIMDYYFANTLKNLDLKKVEDKKKAASELLPQIKIIPNKIEQAHYLQKLALLINVDEKILAESINSYKVYRKPQKSRGESQNGAIKKESEEEILGRRFLSLILGQTWLLEDLSLKFKPYYLPENISTLYTEIINYYNKKGKIFDTEEFIEKLEKKDQKIAFTAKEFLLYFEKEFPDDTPSDLKELKKEVELIIDRLRRSCLNRKLQGMKKEMKEAEGVSDQDKIKKLLSDSNIISSQFK